MCGETLFFVVVAVFQPFKNIKSVLNRDVNSHPLEGLLYVGIVSGTWPKLPRILTLPLVSIFQMGNLFLLKFYF